ncbi:MAG: SIR2 family protein [Chloroflexi bacterium]|nr:SIR2 family protein [Chloroflexota bacterium]
MTIRENDEIKWNNLITHIRTRRCLPIINYDASSAIHFEHAAIVKAWAEDVGFPLTDRSNLTSIAQFVSVTNGGDLAAKVLYLDFLKKSLLDRYSKESLLDKDQKTLSAEPEYFLKTLAAELPDLSLSEVLSRLGFLDFEDVPTDDPLRILAELPLKIYLTTNYSTILEKAIEAASKEPHTEICHWRESLELDVKSVFENSSYWPDENKPLVYHVHGLDAYPHSLVLTEDDHLDFLIKVSADPKVIPIPVNEALGDWAVLLLGYQLHNWDFRTVFKGLVASKRNSRGSPFNVSIQLDPEAEGINISEARAYLKQYFGQVNFTVYWGDAQSFTQELQARWTAFHDR